MAGIHLREVLGHGLKKAARQGFPKEHCSSERESKVLSFQAAAGCTYIRAARPGRICGFVHTQAASVGQVCRLGL